MKKKVLILGGNGMIGHNLFLHLKDYFHVKVTLRRNSLNYEKYKIFNENNSIFGLDAKDIEDFYKIIDEFEPDFVINAIGITKQISNANEKETIYTNGEFPHLISEYVKNIELMVQLSTDCVFSGEKGHYIETDIVDAKDVYGKSKSMGEIILDNVITIRKSTIGFELSEPHGLFEWWYRSSGKISGFDNAIYSGMTTSYLTKILKQILEKENKSFGLFNISSHPISKYELLCNLNKISGRDDLIIERDSEFSCDRSLNGKLFEEKFEIEVPNWIKMLTELWNERFFYERFRKVKR